MTDVLDTVGTASQDALDTVVGGGSIVLDAFRKPSVARRRGERVLRRINIVDGTLALPERALVAYLRNLRRQARRPDVVGTVSRNVLIALHTPAASAARFFHVIERESEIRAQRGGRGPAKSSATGRTATAARRTVRKVSRGRRRTA